jgi:hypothetical protein
LGLSNIVSVVTVVLSRAMCHEPLSTRYWTSKSRKPAVCVWSGTSAPCQVQTMSLPTFDAPVIQALGLV